MRIAILCTVVIGVGLGLAAPIPFLGVNTPPPDSSLPIFDGRAENLGKSKTATAPAPSGENPERKKLRKAVLHFAGQLEVNPCDQRLRKKFLAAVIPFLQSIEKGPREVAVVNGKEQDVSKKYDKPATNAVFAALQRGYIKPSDLVGSWRRMFVSGMSKGIAKRANCDG